MIKLVLLLFGLAFVNSKIEDFTNIDIFSTIQGWSPELTSIIVTGLILLMIYAIYKQKKK